jgi:hypothetical protein
MRDGIGTGQTGNWHPEVRNVTTGVIRREVWRALARNESKGMRLLFAIDAVNFRDTALSVDP